MYLTLRGISNKTATRYWTETMKVTNRNTTTIWQRTRLCIRIETTKHMVLST